MGVSRSDPPSAVPLASEPDNHRAPDSWVVLAHGEQLLEERPVPAPPAVTNLGRYQDSKHLHVHIHSGPRQR